MNILPFPGADPASADATSGADSEFDAAAEMARVTAEGAARRAELAARRAALEEHVAGLDGPARRRAVLAAQFHPDGSVTGPRLRPLPRNDR